MVLRLLSPVLYSILLLFLFVGFVSFFALGLHAWLHQRPTIFHISHSLQCTLQTFTFHIQMYFTCYWITYSIYMYTWKMLIGIFKDLSYGRFSRLKGTYCNSNRERELQLIERDRMKWVDRHSSTERLTELKGKGCLAVYIKRQGESELFKPDHW